MDRDFDLITEIITFASRRQLKCQSIVIIGFSTPFHCQGGCRGSSGGNCEIHAASQILAIDLEDSAVGIALIKRRQGVRCILAGAAVIAERKRERGGFAWDIDHPSAARPSDKISNLDIIRKNINLLENPDLLFLETNGWTAHAPGHGSLIDAQPYLDIIKPRKVILLHLSGHSDTSGQPANGWSDAQWRKSVKQNPPFPDYPMLIGNQGMILAL